MTVFHDTIFPELLVLKLSLTKDLTCGMKLSYYGKEKAKSHEKY